MATYRTGLRETVAFIEGCNPDLGWGSQTGRLSGLAILQAGSSVQMMRDILKTALKWYSGAQQVANAEIVLMPPSMVADIEEYRAVFDSAGWTGIPT